MKGPSNRWLAAFGLASLVPCLAVPISNPDLFWHLSAARRMLELGAIPVVDWMSSTLSGEPWTDFEWLQELLYGGAHRAFGMQGLWGLKIALMIGAALVLWKMLGLYGVAAPYRWTAMAFWGSASLSRSDLRPEWFSVIFFGVLFLRLEALRKDRWAPSWPWAFPFFALWVNLHAGFAYGLVLIALYAALERRPKTRRGLLLRLGAAVAGTFAQPFGVGLYRVLWQHWTQLGSMQSFILEWRGIGLEDLWHLPYWILLAASFGLALAMTFKREKPELAPLGALLGVSYSAFRHVRLAAYQATLAIPLSAKWASRFLPDPPAAAARWVCLLLISGCGAFGLIHAKEAGTFQRVFDDRYAPVMAARFLAQEKAALSPLILYNDQFGWGGYLGYRLYPDYRIFQDGRYIFHPYLKEEAAAIGSAEGLDSFFNRYKVDGAIMENFPRMMTTTRVSPDGKSFEVPRPYYTIYFPKARWALVYWDDKALIFVKRETVDKRWLAGHEYRLALPNDEFARNDALARGEIKKEALDAESQRHSQELLDLSHAGD